MSYASGKRSKAISDRSGMEYPYREMVKEWNGSLVHISEFEPKHPQLDPPYHKADAIALANARPRPPENEKEFLLFITSGFFAETGDSGIGGTSMTVAQSNDILGTKLTSFEVSTSVGTDFTIVIS